MCQINVALEYFARKLIFEKNADQSAWRALREEVPGHLSFARKVFRARSLPHVMRRRAQGRGDLMFGV
ncbi:hypothetical protein BZK31_20060 [Pseudomonas floridensis]|uniref:Uncharacterized protein n=1 Tax=Pseudomonas floridensis TaxID=1958950 RepID=A0A1X0N1Y3_9PSED|nr:hypothetical protein BZK31_20060 [Pseudomonas floridensis]